MDPIFLMMIILSIIRVTSVILLSHEWILSKKKNVGLLTQYSTMILIAFIFRILDLIFWFYLIENLAFLIYIQFCKNTFNSNQKYIATFLTAFTVLSTLIQMPMAWIIYIEGALDQVLLVFWIYFLHGFIIIFIGIWFLISAFRAYNNIKNDTLIKPWVKRRYFLINIYSIFFIGMGIMFCFLEVSVDLVFNWAFLVLFLLVVIDTIFDFIIWALPNLLRRILHLDPPASPNNEFYDEKKIMEEMRK